MAESAATPRSEILLCILLWSLGGLTGPMLYPVLPDMAGALNEAPARVHLTVSLFFAGFALSHLVLLRLVERLDFLDLIALSLVLFIVASILAALAANVETVIAARFVQGLSYGVLPTAVRALLCRNRSAAAANRDLSIVAGVVFLIPIGTPVAGAALAERFGWSSVFWFQWIYALAVLVPVLLHRKTGEPPEQYSVRRVARVPTADILKRMTADRAGLVAAAQMVLLYSLVMLLPFDIARVVPSLSEHAMRDAAILVAASFAAIALGSFLAARRTSAFTPGLLATCGAAAALAAVEALAQPSLIRFGVGTTLISVGLGLTVWSAMARAMTAGGDAPLFRSAVLGFVQYGGAFLVVTFTSLCVPPLAFGHFAVATGVLVSVLLLTAASHRTGIGAARVAEQ
ncbi:MFS transporter [Pontivivens ytuae]|uniref:MFS transporter n=1 Tax=Pontivivens ytuae TaxID=2789856 RepID=A0A7S9LTD5_9RHOB|nr:MFS transporter [Pontivivens ytuae]QPH54791.1 MFS transporter [Pontivivens ytuae]